MTGDQIAIAAIILAAAGLFIWGRWRYDLVAFAALIAAVIAGVVPAATAFDGFGHPAVVTVLMVLILSRGLSNSGAVDLIVRPVRHVTGSAYVHIAALAGIAAFLSAFMNNVAALALLLPVALQSCRESERSPGLVLMPLAFGSILGGLSTMIGTPPNLIVASYRTPDPFTMFDFAPVGALTALAGIAFVTIVGWRLLPARVREGNVPADLFQIADYVTEAEVTEDSGAVDTPIRELDETVGDMDARIIGLIRNERRILSSARRETVRQGDVLLIEADPDGIAKVVDSLKLELVGEKSKTTEKALHDDDVALVEAVVQPRSRLEGRTAASLRLGSRYDVNLLAVSRQGRPHRGRLRNFRFNAGDILLLQGMAEDMPETLARLGCLPLAERDMHLGRKRTVIEALGLFVAAVAAAAFGLVPITVSFSAAAIGMVLLRILNLREAYESVDWPVLVLLGAMIPVGGALEATGTTQLIADGILAAAAGIPAIVLVALILVITMTLSDIMNNAATTIVMAPIALAVAQALGASAEPFLMAVAIGASCAFLTPIGHQNNTLIMGPGGYRFSDYWRMGLPLEIVIVLVSVPLIALFWPLGL